MEDNIMNLNFYPRKLSTLEIKLRDNYGNPIKGVLIFLSSTSRKNYVKI